MGFIERFPRTKSLYQPMPPMSYFLLNYNDKLKRNECSNTLKK